MTSDEAKENPRKTQFAGFANALYAECTAIASEGFKNNWNNIDIDRKVIQHIAQRAYDLVGHATRYHLCGDKYYKSSEEKVRAIPDLTEWPKEQSDE